MVEADQLQMDLSPSDSVTAIVSLHLMAPDMPPHRLDVRTLASLDSIVTQLAGYQGGQLPLLP